MISVTSVLERFTCCSCRQRSQAAGPIQLKFEGRDREVIPASRKQSVAFGSSFSVQTHLIDEQVAHGYLLKRRDHLCSLIEPHLCS